MITGLAGWVRLLVLVGVLVGVVGCAPRAASWQETFDAPGDWHLTSDATADVTIVDGKLRIHVLNWGEVAWSSLDRVYGDFRLSVETTQVSGPIDNEYGVLVRMDGDQQFYAFSISGDGYVRVARFDTETWDILGPDWQPSDAINQGEATNVLEVEAAGPQFVFRVNGEEVSRVEDETLAKGKIGLYAGAFSEGDVVITFDNLEVEPLP